jgi:hypothetical protein
MPERRMLSIVVGVAILATAPLVLQAKEPDSLTLGSSGRPLLRYNAAYIKSPQPTAPWYGRSGFIHPVYTPGGRIVTDDFPTDHLHQHGLMFAWTSARIDGRHIDFWNSSPRSGVVEHVETVHADDESIEVKLRHLDPTVAPSRDVLHEVWQIRRVEHETLHVFDLVSTQRCVMNDPLKIAKYHYGAMGIRGSSQWMGGKAMMQTSEGKDRVAGNHSRPNWVAMTGEVDGATCGIAALSHPTNFRAPQPVRLHPDMPYFCFAPMVEGDFEIVPGEAYVSRFRFAAFDGQLNPAQLDALWRDYAAETPAVRQSNR